MALPWHPVGMKGIVSQVSKAFLAVGNRSLSSLVLQKLLRKVDMGIHWPTGIPGQFLQWGMAANTQAGHTLPEVGFLAGI